MHNENKKIVEQAIADLQQGKTVLLLDSKTRENEGDMIFAAEMATEENVNFLIQHGSGIVCLPMLEEQAQRLGLSPMVNPANNSSRHRTPFTQSIGATQGTTTGVSAADRAHTIRTAMDSRATAVDLSRPGHVFPLIAQQHGVLKRAGHTEGAVDLMRLAGLKPGAVLCEVMNRDGTMAKGEQLHEFAKTHQLTLLTIEALIDYRRQQEMLIAPVAESKITLDDCGEWTITLFRNPIDDTTVTVLRSGDSSTGDPLVRIHSACFTGETLGSLHCDCRQQLTHAMKQISQHGGYLIYLEQEGRGIGLVNKIRAYDLQQRHTIDTFAANRQLGLPEDNRDYTIAAKVLHFYRQRSVKLLTNNPEKVAALNHYQIAVEQITMPVNTTCHNHAYLKAKATLRQHAIEMAE